VKDLFFLVGIQKNFLIFFELPLKEDRKIFQIFLSSCEKMSEPEKGKPEKKDRDRKKSRAKWRTKSQGKSR